MSRSAGTKLGPYEIQSSLGAGGMGESIAQETLNPAGSTLYKLDRRSGEHELRAGAKAGC
jgi:hypothetical protein